MAMAPTIDPSKLLVLYDGTCGLCNKTNQFILARDRRDQFLFATLQGPLAAELLARHGRRAEALDTSYVVVRPGTPEERVLDRSRAGLFVLGRLGGLWSLAGVFRLVPRLLADAVYDFVARHRYGWFGKSDHCVLPSPRDRAKFVDGL